MTAILAARAENIQNLGYKTAPIRGRKSRRTARSLGQKLGRATTNQIQKLLQRDARLFKYSLQSSFRNVRSRMIWNGGSSSGDGIIPDLVTAFRLTIEYESCLLQPADHLSGGQDWKLGHTDTVTGISRFWTGFVAGAIPSGRGSPCSKIDSMRFRATS